MERLDLLSCLNQSPSCQRAIWKIIYWPVIKDLRCCTCCKCISKTESLGFEFWVVVRCFGLNQPTAFKS